MRHIIERILIFLLAVAIICWGGYHVLNYTSESIETKTVFTETVFRSLSAKGVVIRSEQLLYKTEVGAERYLYEDGTRVGMGQPVVEYYSGDVKNRNVQNMYSYESEIAMLEEAQNKSVNNFSTAPIISRDIREQLSNLSIISATGKCTELESLRANLTSLVNRREIAIGKAENFESRITQLSADIETLKSESNLDNITTGVTPVSGYFAKNVDGYEEVLIPDFIEEYSVNDFVELMEAKAKSIDKNTSGRIVTSSKWYLVVCLPSYEIEWVRSGQVVQINFSHITKPIDGKVEKIIFENNNETAVIVIQSDQISEEIINLRMTDVDISFARFVGLKIDSSSIRFKENENGEKIKGVYVLVNQEVVFKKIDPIYEEPDFILSKIDYSDSKRKEYLSLYDKIVKGNVHEGKIIK